MTLSAGITLALLLVLLGTVAWFRFTRGPRPVGTGWRPLLGSSNESSSYRVILPVSYRLEPGLGGSIDEPRLAKAVALAYTCLSECGAWNPSELWAALTGTRILISREAAELHSVADFLSEKHVTVGPGYTDLAHAFAHVAEREIDKRVDVEHVQWTKRGIAQAVVRYTARVVAG